MWRRFFTLVLITAALLLAAGCTRREPGEQKSSLTVKGSDTMVNLMSNLAESFMREHKNVSVSVTGGGSGTGIAALINGTTDICSSSRSLSDKERDLAKNKRISPVEHVVGLDGLAVMVNPKNPISELSLEQLRRIYTGEYTNWSDVGGPKQEIVLLSRESNSGTYVYFQEHVLNKSDYSPTARLMPSTAAIVQSVSSDAGAIGYGGVAYAENPSVKILNVRPHADSAAVAPTEANVHNGTYPISRPLFLCTNGQPTGAVKAFIEYCVSPQGQAVVKETGYMAIR
jgi:phosphate transport system substrate-binding protein